MSGVIVELVVLGLKEGVDVRTDGLHKTILEENFDETNRRPGCHAIYMGIPEEQPGILYLIAGECRKCQPPPQLSHCMSDLLTGPGTEWESMQAHKDWQTHADYPKFMAKTFSICDPSTVHVMHFYLMPQDSITSRASPFNAPVTEVSWVYYPHSVDVEAHRAIYESYRTEAAKVTSVQGMQGGWVVEETELPDTGGEKVKLFMEYSGRASTAEHIQAEKELTKDGGVGSALLKESKSKFTVHVAFQWTSSSQWQVS